MSIYWSEQLYRDAICKTWSFGLLKWELFHKNKMSVWRWIFSMNNFRIYLQPLIHVTPDRSVQFSLTANLNISNKTWKRLFFKWKLEIRIFCVRYSTVWACVLHFNWVRDHNIRGIIIKISVEWFHFTNTVAHSHCAERPLTAFWWYWGDYLISLIPRERKLHINE